MGRRKDMEERNCKDEMIWEMGIKGEEEFHFTFSRGVIVKEE